MKCRGPETDAAEIGVADSSFQGCICVDPPLCVAGIGVRGTLEWGFQCSETHIGSVRVSSGRTLSLDGVCHFPKDVIAPFLSFCCGLGLLWRIVLFYCSLLAEGEAMCGTDPESALGLTVLMSVSAVKSNLSDLGMSSPNPF